MPPLARVCNACPYPDIENIQHVATGILRHSLIKNYKAEAEGLSIEEIIKSFF